MTKSVTSALTGIAIERGEIESVNVKMMDYFPELQDGIKDARKNDITLEHMLQMRAGYPWEESSPELFDMLYGGFRPSYLASVPLAYTPGEDMVYSNLTSHLIGVIVSRATGESLMDYAQEHLLGPLGITPGEWTADWEGYNNGHADLYLSARDMAKFRLLYLNGGEYDGRQIVSSEWVEKSLGVYSEEAWDYRIGRNVKDMSYGYQWWSARAGQRWYSFAWGHGGQQIALIDDMDMVVVVTADPLVGQHGDKPWKYEKKNLNLVGDFVASLP